MSNKASTENFRGKGLGKGDGRGRNNGGAFGNGGYCVCLKCGKRVPHERGAKCTTVECPNCGHRLIRDEILKK
jgi:DNA-directed RNA polymerase subunit RPC12/RpoP